MEYFAEYDFNGPGKIFYFVDGEKKYISKDFDYDKWKRAKMSPDEEAQLSAQSCVRVERKSNPKYKSTKNYKYVNYNNGPVWEDIQHKKLFGFKNGKFWTNCNHFENQELVSRHRSAANRLIKEQGGKRNETNN